MAPLAPLPPPMPRTPLPNNRPTYTPPASYTPPAPAYAPPPPTYVPSTSGGSGKPSLPPLPNQQGFNTPPSLPPTLRVPSPPPAAYSSYSAPSSSYTTPIYNGYSSPSIDPRTLRYRVIVTADSYTVQEQVRQLVPGAFRTRYGGRTMMQAGAFSDRAQADELAQKLLSNGIPATVDTRN